MVQQLQLNLSKSEKLH